MFAGGLYNENMTTNITYLDNNTPFWTLTLGASFYSYFWDSNANTLIGYDVSFGIGNIRAVITLKPSVETSGGTGTSTNPYIIK